MTAAQVEISRAELAHDQIGLIDYQRPKPQNDQKSLYTPVKVLCNREAYRPMTWYDTLVIDYS